MVIIEHFFRQLLGNLDKRFCFLAPNESRFNSRRGLSSRTRHKYALNIATRTQLSLNPGVLGFFFSQIHLYNT